MASASLVASAAALQRAPRACLSTSAHPPHALPSYLAEFRFFVSKSQAPRPGHRSLPDAALPLCRAWLPAPRALPAWVGKLLQLCTLCQSRSSSETSAKCALAYVLRVKPITSSFEQTGDSAGLQESQDPGHPPLLVHVLCFPLSVSACRWGLVPRWETGLPTFPCLTSQGFYPKEGSLSFPVSFVKH